MATQQRKPDKPSFRISPPPSIKDIEGLAKNLRWNPSTSTLEEFCASEVVRIIYNALRVVDREVTPGKIRGRLSGFMGHAEYRNGVRAYTKSKNPIAYFWHWAVTDDAAFSNHVREYMYVKSSMCEW